MEGDTGLEPAPSAWKAEMLATNTNPPYKTGFFILCRAPVHDALKRSIYFLIQWMAARDHRSLGSYSK